MDCYALIVAGGKGSRMQSAFPKQFMRLADLPLLMHTIKRFAGVSQKITLIVVLPADQIDAWSALCKQFDFDIGHKVVEGGATRYDSVFNGLKACGTKGIVAIHDGVRPLVSSALIERCMLSAETSGSGIPALPVTQSLRKVTKDTNHAVSREGIFEVQTPQCFQLEKLMRCYETGYQKRFTDDATVYESQGFPITLVKGDPVNIKITTPVDLKIAEAILGLSKA